MHRIALVDDHAIVREGFRALIERERDLVIAGEFGCAAEARTGIAALAPDLVVLDLSLPDGSGLSLIPALRQSLPEVRIVVLSMHTGPQYHAEAMARGADGYVSKSVATAELVTAIRTVLAGNRYLSSDLGSRQRAVAGASAPPLTPRESEVLRLLADGKAPKQIAELLHIGVKTAYVHRARVLEKLGVRNEVELYRHVVEQNLLGQ